MFRRASRKYERAVMRRAVAAGNALRHVARVGGGVCPAVRWRAAHGGDDINPGFTQMPFSPTS